MNGLILLLYCIEILGALGDNIPGYTTVKYSESTDSSHTPAGSTSKTEASILTTIVSNSHDKSPSPSTELTTSSTPNSVFYKKECLSVLMVSGGLIIVCAILLVSALMLAWKVCQLSRRIKELSTNADLISNSEYWMGTAEKNKSMSDTEAKETTVLMADISNIQEEMGNGTAKEEEGKVNKDEQLRDENKKEVEDAANDEAASTTPVTVADNSSSSKPQEVTDSQSAKAVAASSSKGTEELKDVV